MTLSRDDILDYEDPPRQIQLPSGVIVIIKYLPYFLVLDILVAVVEEKEKELIFSEKVINCLLRENDERDINSFSREDQVRLIEVAANEWGCKQEYDNLPDSLRAEERLYKATFERNKRFQAEMVERMKAVTSILGNVTLPRFDWLTDYKNNLGIITAQMNSPVHSQLIENINKINQDTFEQFSKLGQHIIQISGIDALLRSVNSALSIAYEQSLITVVEDALSNYRSVMDNLVSFDQFRIMPEVERYYPSVEMRNLSIAANVALGRDDLLVPGEVIISGGNELTSWLGDLDASFLDMLQGAEQTIRSQNPDRCRHFASSHRELCTQLLHYLAPDDEVKKWTHDPNHFQDGRPTRKARLLFIARHRNNQPFVEFFISSFLAQMKLLNADEHRRHHDYGERELRILHNGFLSTLGLIMQIVRGGE